MKSHIVTPLLPRGFAFSAVACGIKKSGLDLGLISSDKPAAAACVFTTNQVQAAPVQISRRHLRKSRHLICGIVVNSGNANCATGPDGISAALNTARKVARELGCRRESQILICSTGVIGIPLRVENILNSLPKLVRSREDSAAAFARFTRAILTTDMGPKWAAASCRIGGKSVRIAGCCKGAGMIHPRMATMLAFIATDANLPARLLDRALREAVAQSFNAISVDGDTSTNDTVTLLANGASKARPLRAASGDYRKFVVALEKVCQSLAEQIVADGEGAKRIVEIRVCGAKNDAAADKIARAIANSPLVKTALAGGDPNWGRILAAAGYSEVRFDPERVEICMAGITMCRNGRAVSFDEKKAHRQLLENRVSIVVGLHSGRGSARIWTCDFTEEYVKINSSYRS